MLCGWLTCGRQLAGGVALFAQADELGLSFSLPFPLALLPAAALLLGRLEDVQLTHRRVAEASV